MFSHELKNLEFKINFAKRRLSVDRFSQTWFPWMTVMKPCGLSIKHEEWSTVEVNIMLAESQKGVNAVPTVFHWEPEGRYHHRLSTSDSTLLVVNGTCLNIINALLALNWWWGQAKHCHLSHVWEVDEVFTWQMHTQSWGNCDWRFSFMCENPS